MLFSKPLLGKALRIAYRLQRVIPSVGRITPLRHTDLACSDQFRCVSLQEEELKHHDLRAIFNAAFWFETFP